MAITTAGLPCDPWPVQWCCPITGASIAATGWALEAATEVLWALSGRRYGTCTVTSRPCREDCGGGSGFRGQWWEPFNPTLYPQPALIGGQWFNIVCGSCGTGCSCTAVEQVILPAPVGEIIEIQIDGTPLPTGSYRVDDWRILVRQDGGRWPLCQDLSKPAGAVGTWTVTATYGEAVPRIGQIAVGDLACELMKACGVGGGGDCELPPNLQSLAREGVTIQFTEDVQSRLRTDGRLGIWSIDIFLLSANPRGLQTRSRVYSPDVPRPRVTG